METAIELTIEPRKRPVGAGQVRRLLPYRERRMVGPFIFVDVVGPETLKAGSSVEIDAHPHIGLSTVTYLFDGRMVHRDSTGSVQTIEPGAVNWMTAGSGVTHTERSHPDDIPGSRALHGLQTWVALPEEAEEADALFQHAAASDIPTDRLGQSTVRVAVGSGWDHESPVSGSSPMVLAEVSLDADSPFPIATDHRELAVLALSVDVRVNNQAVDAGRLAVLRSGARVTLSGTGTAVVLGGEPLGKRHIWWNFVSSDRDRIEEAKRDWETQRFPTVPNDHQDWIPLPGS